MTGDRTDKDILTSHRMLLLVSPAATFADNFSMCILSHMLVAALAAPL
jgi:hypothetical protein